MGIFDFFRKEDEATKIRKQVRKGFDKTVKDVLRNSEMTNPMVLGTLVQSAIANFYQSIKNDLTLERFCKNHRIDFCKIVEEECKRTLSKYLKQ